MNGFRAGAGCADIRFPESLFPMQGFKGVHDDPAVRILYIESGEPFVLAAYEMVMLPDDLIDECRETIARLLSVKKDAIWLHVTHAITTPHAPGGPLIGPGGNIIEQTPEQIEQGKRDKATFYEILLSATEIAASQTAGSITDARIYVGEGESHQAINRDIESEAGWWIGRAPSGDSNHNMTVLRLTDETGSPIAALYHYAIKPCVIDNSGMAQGTRLVSSDVTGYACRMLEERYGVPVLFTMSAAGDQIPRETVLYDEVRDGQIETTDLGVERGLELVEEIGAALAQDVERIYESAEPCDISVIQSRSTSFDYETKGRTDMKLRRSMEYVAEGSTEVPVSVVRLGGIALVGTKPEINCGTERALIERSPAERTLLISMVNGGLKYMPERTAYERVTWEAQTARLMPGAAERFVDTAVRMIGEM